MAVLDARPDPIALDPGCTVLPVIDMQRDLLELGGFAVTPGVALACAVMAAGLFAHAGGVPQVAAPVGAMPSHAPADQARRGAVSARSWQDEAGRFMLPSTNREDRAA